MKITVTSSPIEKIRTEAVIVLHENSGLLAESKNADLNKHFTAFAKEVSSKKCKREWFCTLEKSSGCSSKYLLLDSATLGMYAPGDEQLKVAAARAVARCRDYSISKIALVAHHELAAEKAAAMLEGVILGDFVDLRYKNSKAQKDSARQKLEIQIVVPKGKEKSASAAVKRIEAIALSQNSARELTNSPNNDLTPAKMVSHAKALAKKYNMQIAVWDEKKLKKEGFIPTYEVGRGSEHPPRMFVLRHRPARVRVKQHICLVGKGMTFDTGGLCIKPSLNMHQMNNDMGGAAAVLGAMEAIGRLKLPIKVTAIIGSAHNAVDGAAYHPGSIITAKNGKTIYVENTDAEGRLVLSDCLYQAGREKADIIWDYATLTGSVANALGQAYAGLFTDDEELRTVLLEAAQNSGEGLWPLPLCKEYAPYLNHTLADLNNISRSLGAAGGTQAANFLQHFVPENTRWAHMDIAGTATTKSAFRYFSTGGTGFGVRLTLEALRIMLEK